MADEPKGTRRLRTRLRATVVGSTGSDTVGAAWGTELSDSTASASDPARARTLSPCAFCAIVAGTAAAHRVAESDCGVAFLDARPLFHGHVLVIPREHRATLADLPSRDVGPLFGLARLVSAAVESVLGAEGSFIAVNNRVSQSVPHLHVHVVPRRRGDGLRGFFWPRHKYTTDGEAASIASRLRSFCAVPQTSERP